MQVIRSRAASAEAEAQQKKADLDQALLNLQYTKIVAPVTGVVSDRTVEVGQNVAPGQELMKVIPLNDVWITANFKETQLPPENATGNYVKVVQRIPVKIVLDPGENKDQSLRPGMSVDPKVWIRQ